MRVFLTGTGLLGPNLVRALRARGHTVTALVRSTARAQALLGSDVALVEGDLGDVGRFASRLRGADVLIHAGACYREHFARLEGESDPEPRRVNVDGTMALLEAAEHEGVRNVVYVSSGGVLAPGERPMDESNAYDEQNGDPYFRSKIAAEKAIVGFLAAHPAMRVVLILPSVMVGPRDMGPSPTGSFLQKIVRGEVKLLLPGSMSLVDARDVAEAIIAAIDKGTSGERYVIGGRNYPVADIIVKLSAAAGRTPPSTRPPVWLLFKMVRLIEAISRWRGAAPPVRLRDLERLQRNLRWNSDKAQRVLGVQFRPLEDTLVSCP